jgi:hypothetical protein
MELMYSDENRPSDTDLEEMKIRLGKELEKLIK